MTRSAYLPESPPPPSHRTLDHCHYAACSSRVAGEPSAWLHPKTAGLQSYPCVGPLVSLPCPLTMAFEPLPRRYEHQQSSMHPIELRVLSAFESVNLRIPFHGQRRRAWRCLSFRPCAYSSTLVSGARACACARACADVFPCHVPARERVCLVTFVVAPTGRRPRVSYLHAGRTGSVHMAA